MFHWKKDNDASQRQKISDVFFDSTNKVLSLRDRMLTIDIDKIKNSFLNHRTLLKYSAIVLFIVLVSIFSFRSRADIANFYPTNCLGNWENPQNAQGVPDIKNNSDKNNFLPSNSAVLNNTNAPLYCGNFSGEIPQDAQAKKFILRFSITALDRTTESQNLITTNATDSNTNQLTPTIDNNTITLPQTPTPTPVLIPDPTSTPTPDSSLSPTPTPDTTNQNQPVSFSSPNIFPKAFAQDISTIPNANDYLNVSYTTNGTDWKVLGTISEANISDPSFEIPLENMNWSDIAKIQISVTPVVTIDKNKIFYLDGMWIESDYDKADTTKAIPTITLKDSQNTNVDVIRGDADFSSNEDAVFNVSDPQLSNYQIAKLVSENKATVLEDKDNVLNNIVGVEPFSTSIPTPTPNTNEIPLPQLPTIPIDQNTLSGATDIINNIVSPQNISPTDTPTPVPDATPPVIPPSSIDNPVDTSITTSKSDTSFLFNIFGKKALADTASQITETKVLDSFGNDAKIETSIENTIVDGKNTQRVRIKKPDHEFRPGKYSLHITLLTDTAIIETQQDFTWGVLVINTNKSIYNTGDNAYLQIGVLNDQGHTICAADLEMGVTTPSGNVTNFSTADGSIVKDSVCGPDNIVLSGVPDYHANFLNTNETGIYKIKLTATTDNGVKTINDSFQVDPNVPFDVERVTATRIQPLAIYPVTLNVTAKEDFSGTIVEHVPSSFIVSTAKRSIGYDGTFETSSDKLIYWNLDFKKGETKTLGYYYDAPNVSPDMLLLGPLEFFDGIQNGDTTGKLPEFKEIRKWQIASDTPPTNFSYKRTITIDHTKVPNTDQSNFPVLVDITDNALKTVANSGHVTNANGYDIEFFTASDLSGTKLSHEIEFYDGSAGHIIMWVKLPLVTTASNTVFYMGYGNSSITTSQEDKTGLWSNYKGVWHLPNGTTLTANDSSGNGNNGTLGNTSSTNPIAISAMINGGAAFNDNNWVESNTTNMPTGSANRTLSGWIYLNSYPASEALFFGYGTTGTSNTVYELFTNTGHKLNFSQWGGSVVGSTTLLLNTWYYVTCTNNGNNLIIYINGVQDGSGTVTVNTSTSSMFDIGRFNSSNGSTRHLNGNVDEVKIANSQLSADWIKTEYNNQNSPSTFISVGSETTSYCFATTTGNWSDGTKWTGCSGSGGKPGTGDDVVINEGVTITMDEASVSLSNILISNTGTLDTSSSNYALTGMSMNVQGTLIANASTITLTGTTGTLFTLGGTFTPGGSTVVMNPNADVTLTSGAITFYNLSLTPTITAAHTYTFGTGALTINGDFNINPTASSSYLLSVIMNANITVASTGTTTITGTSSATSKLIPYVAATSDSGGTITYSGGYTIHTFTSSGTYTANSSHSVTTLVVAGGGGGNTYTGGNGGGGGGAGGVLYQSSSSISGGSLTVTVGGGGASGGNNGQNSVFNGLTAIGGGGGGTAGVAGNTGGSGGGGGCGRSGLPAGTGGSGTSGQGSAGGDGDDPGMYYTGGGGGGAGGIGNKGGQNSPRGNGGNGLQYSISGVATYYGGGGGGGAGAIGRSPAGGLGGGGNGTDLYGVTGSAGTANTGGGGGGSANSSAFSGGSGIVIVKYQTNSSFNLSTGFLNTAINGTLDGANSFSTITLTGTSGTLFTLGGAFTPGYSTVVMNPNADVTLTSGAITFNNLSLTPTITAAHTYNFGSGALTINGDFTINPTASSSYLLTVNMGAAITVAPTGTTTITGTSSATSKLISGTAPDDTGGTITYSGGYTIHTFTSSGTYTANSNHNVQVLVVGGGGGGGENGSGWASGGGGAGGLIYNTSFGVTTGNTSVTVGNGGAVNTTGNNSVFSSLIAYGGGHGGRGSATGTNGGSGGGGGYNYTGGTGVAGQGNNGGNGSSSLSAGGGGGSSQVGTNATSNIGGKGGDGTSISISGTAVYYAGGGGGGQSSGTYGASGAGGGGQGGTMYSPSTAGTNGTGGGGGGGYSVTNISSVGGSGIVMISYPTNSSAYSYNLTTGYLNVASAGTLDSTGLNSTITLTGTTGTLFTKAGTFIQATSTVVMNSDADVTLTSGAITFYNLSLTPTITAAHTYNFGSGALTINGDLTINPTASSGYLLTVNMGANITVAGTTTITKTTSATSTLKVRPVSTDYNLSTGLLNIATGGTLDCTASSATIYLTGTSGTLFTLGGTFTIGTSTVVMNPNADVTLTSGAITFNNLSLTPTITAAHTYNFGSGALTINGNFNINPTASSGYLLTVNMGANITVAGTTTITKTTSATSTLKVRPVSTDYNLSTGLLNIATGGTLDCTSSASTITLTGTSGTLFTLGGTFTMGTSTINLSGNGTATVNSGAPTVYNLTSSGTGTKTMGGNITVSNLFSITNGTFAASSYTLSLGGTASAPFVTPSGGGTFSAGTGQVYYFGTNAGGITIESSITYYNLQVNQSGVTFKPNGIINGNVASTLTVTNGTFDTTSSNYAINFGKISIASASTAILSANASAITLNAVASSVLFTRGASGVFNQGTSTVTVASASGTPSLLSTATTFHILNINAGATVVNAGGIITLDTASGNALTINGVLNDGGNQITATTGTLTIGSTGILCLGGAAAAATNACNATATATTATIMPAFATYSFNATSIVRYVADATTTISATPTYGILNLTPRLTAARAYTFATGAVTINNTTANAFVIQPITGAFLLTVNMGGNITVPATGTTTITRTTSTSKLLTRPASTDYNLSTGYLNIAAGGTLDCTSSASNITLTGTSGTLFTFAGTFTAANSTVNLSGNGDATINSGSPTFYNLTSSGSGVKTLGAAITIASGGTLSVSAGTFNPSTYLITGSGTNTLSVGVSGTIRVIASTFAGNYSAGFTTRTLSSGSTVDYFLSGTQTISNAISPYSNLTVSTGGTKTLGGDLTVANVMTIGTGATLDESSYNLTLSGTTGTPFVKTGTFIGNTGTITYTGNYVSGNTTIVATTYYNLVFNNVLETYILDGATTVGNNLTITQGILDDGGYQITGNSTGTLSLASGTSLNLGSASVATVFPTNFTNAHISLNSASVVNYQAGVAQTISAIPNYGNLIISVGAIKSLSGTSVVNGNLNILAGSLDTVSGQNYALSVGGNWANSGTFIPENGLVTLNSGTTASVGGGPTTFYDLAITHTGAKEVDFSNSSPNIIHVTHNFTVTGHSGQLIKLYSDSVGNKWHFHPTGTATVDYADVKDGGCEAGAITISPTHSTDSHNNDLCWSFYVPTITFGMSGNSADLGVLTPTQSQYATSGAGSGGSTGEVEAHNFTVTDNSPNGYSVSVIGQSLTDAISGHIISPIGVTNSAPNPGHEQFGLRINASGGTGSVSSPYFGSGFAYAADATNASQICSASTGDGVTTTYSVRYLSNISPTTNAGQYHSTLKYLVTGNF